jgi:hypothetical protein
MEDDQVREMIAKAKPTIIKNMWYYNWSEGIATDRKECMALAERLFDEAAEHVFDFVVSREIYEGEQTTQEEVEQFLKLQIGYA